MKNNWKKVKLGEVLEHRNERPNPDKILLGEIPIVAKIGFNTGEIELRKESKTKTNMILVKPSDLVISGINAAKGAIAIYNEEKKTPAAATIHYSSYKIDIQKVYPKYIWYYLRSDSFRRILIDNLPGGIKSEVRPTKLLSIEISLPSIQEQKQIIGKIDRLMTKIKEIKSINNNSIEDVQKIFPRIIDSLLKPYEKSTFSEIIIFKPRSGPSFRTSPDWEGTPVLMPSSVSGFGIDTKKIEFGIGTERISNKDLLEEDDLIIARGNKPEQVGNAGVVPKAAEGWVCANLLMRFKVDQKRVTPNFCEYWLRSDTMRKYVKKHMKGTSPSIQKINQKIILEFPFPLPPLHIQIRIVSYLNKLQLKLDKLKNLQSETEKELEELVPSILDRAFNGEL